MHKLFESQQDNERIYLVIREHWVLLAGRLLVVVFLITVGLAARFFIPWLIAVANNSLFVSLLSLLVNILVLGLLLGALLIFIYYYLSVQIITDMRMVDVDQHSLFKRNVTEIQIENVEEVTSTAHGALATLFNFGHVKVQTSGAEIGFVFENVPHPEQVKKLILDLYEQHQRVHHSSKTQTVVAKNPRSTSMGI